MEKKQRMKANAIFRKTMPFVVRKPYRIYRVSYCVNNRGWNQIRVYGQLHPDTDMVTYMGVAPKTTLRVDLYTKLCNISSKFKELLNGKEKEAKPKKAAKPVKRKVSKPAVRRRTK